jgi:methionine sulfoxide reductase heme-binding subunit
MTVNPTPHLFWITSRAAGFAALILASLAVAIGLLMSTKLLKGRTTELRAAHETMALSSIVAIAVHGASLLGDQYLHPSVLDVAIPFVSSYKTFWTSLGIVSAWGLILLGLSYYARRRIGAVRWRKLHRFTALLWIAGLVHALGEGTDAGQVWFLAMLATVAIPALALLAARLMRAGASSRACASSPAGARTASSVAAPRAGASSPAGARTASSVSAPIGLGEDRVTDGLQLSASAPESLRDLPAQGVVRPPSPVGATSGGG